MTRYLPLLVCVIAVLPPSVGAVRAQVPARVDTLEDGTRTFHYDQVTDQMSPEEKITILNEKVLKNPADGRSWNDLGVLLAEQENWPAARDAFIHAVQCDKTNGDYHRNLGLVFSRLDMPEMAVAELGEYRKFDQFGGLDYWRLIGGAQRKAGQADEARKTYRDGLASLKPPVGETFRVVLALHELETEAADEQAVRDLLDEYTKPARTFLDGLAGKENAEAEDGWREASAVIQYRVALLVEDGKLMEQSGLDAEAIGLYQDAYRLAPERPDVLPRLVDLYLKLGRVDEADAAAARARKEHPEWTGTWIATGKVHEKGDRLDDALAAYNKAWEIEKLEDLRVAIGNLHIRLGHDQEASEWLRAGVTPDTKPEVVYNYAVSLMRGEKFQAAIPPLRTVVRERPEMAQGWQALAQCLQATGNYAGAIEPFEQALLLQPDAKTAFLLGSVAQKAGDNEKAISAYQQALALDPKYAKAQYNLALVFMEAKKYPEAVAAFDALMKIEGPTYRAYNNQGLSYFYLEKYDKALEGFEMALDLEKSAAVMNNIGMTLDKLGDKKEAIAWYQKAKDFQGGKKN
jgi:superkiller protein 3